MLIDFQDEQLKYMRYRKNIDTRIEPHIFTKEDLENENPWEGNLSSAMFAIWSIVYTATQHTLS